MLRWGIPRDIPHMYRFRDESGAYTSPAADSSASAHSCDNGCTDSTTTDNRSSHPRTCPKLLQVVKQLRRKLCKWVVQPRPVFMQWLRWDLVRPDSSERCEAAQGLRATLQQWD